jgi:hypothetical protein
VGSRSAGSQHKRSPITYHINPTPSQGFFTLLDTCTDVVTAWVYAANGNSSWAIICSTLIAASGVVQAVFGFLAAERAQQRREEVDDCTGKAVAVAGGLLNLTPLYYAMVASDHSDAELTSHNGDAALHSIAFLCFLEESGGSGSQIGFRSPSLVPV